MIIKGKDDLGAKSPQPKEFWRAITLVTTFGMPQALMAPILAVGLMVKNLASATGESRELEWSIALPVLLATEVISLLGILVFWYFKIKSVRPAVRGILLGIIFCLIPSLILATAAGINEYTGSHEN